MTDTILIVEDEIKLAELLHDYLIKEGMNIVMIHDGAQVMDAVNKHQPTLILLDLMLPNKDGISLCKDIRQTAPIANTPIIMTTAKVDEIDRLLGLEIGADDYICKPYSPREVVARVKAVLRRQGMQYHQEQVSPLEMNHEKMQAKVNGTDLKLTAVEYELLKTMYESVGKIFSRNQLMDGIYQDHRIVSERTIDSHIKKLRKKISAANQELELIHSVYGVGYKYEQN